MKKGNRYALGCILCSQQADQKSCKDIASMAPPVVKLEPVAVAPAPVKQAEPVKVIMPFAHVGSIFTCGGNPVGLAKCRGAGICSPSCRGCWAGTHWSCCGDPSRLSYHCFPGISREQALENARILNLPCGVREGMVCENIPGVMFGKMMFSEDKVRKQDKVDRKQDKINLAAEKGKSDKAATVKAPVKFKSNLIKDVVVKIVEEHAVVKQIVEMHEEVSVAGFKGIMTPVGVDVIFHLHQNKTINKAMFSSGEFRYSNGIILKGSFLLQFDDNYLTGVGTRHFTDGNKAVQEYWHNGRHLTLKNDIEKVRIVFSFQNLL